MRLFSLVRLIEIAHSGFPSVVIQPGLQNRQSSGAVTRNQQIRLHLHVMGRWKTFTIATPAHPAKKSKTGVQMYGPSGASVWSAPTFDRKRDVLYVATGNNYSDPPTETSDAVVALDRK